MGKEYHPDTPKTRPFSHEKQGYEAKTPPGTHYSPDSGQWDGQLPNPDLVHSATPHYPDYPGPIHRRQWATTIGINFELSPGERAVLQSYAHDSGSPQGCWKAATTIAHELGYTADFVGDARAKLVKLDILKYDGLHKRAKRFILNFDVTRPDTGSEKNVTRSHPGSDKNVTWSDTGLQREKVDTNPGVTPGYDNVTRCDTGVKPGLTPGKLEVTGIKEREDHNLSLSSSSILNSGSPGLTPGYHSRSPTPEDVDIERLVEENWAILKQFWDHQGGATTTYRRKGLDFTIQDITEKREKAAAADLAARTCVHCHTFRNTTDEVKACVRCEDPICVDDRSICRQSTCFRKQGTGSPDRNRGPADHIRR